MADKRTNDEFVDNIKKRISQERTGTTLRFEEPTTDGRCPACGCLSHARVDERKPDGSFGPSSQVRCVNCKRVRTLLETHEESAMTNPLCTRLLARIMIQLTKGDPDLVDGALVQNHIKMPASNVIQVGVIDARNRLRYFKVTVTEMRGPTV
jgi:hypothetical protein